MQVSVNLIVFDGIEKNLMRAVEVCVHVLVFLLTQIHWHLHNVMVKQELKSYDI